MNRDTELALLAGASYESSRSRIDRIPVPPGWSSLNLSSWPAGYGSQKDPASNVPGRVYWQDSATGFEAAAYTKGNDVVISTAPCAQWGAPPGAIASGEVLALGTAWGVYRSGGIDTFLDGIRYAQLDRAQSDVVDSAQDLQHRLPQMMDCNHG